MNTTPDEQRAAKLAFLSDCITDYVSDLRNGRSPLPQIPQIELCPTIMAQIERALGQQAA